MLVTANYCPAQNGLQVFTHLTADNGLLSNTAGAVCQDSRGYIWIGTTDGLQRYDGSRFITYRSDLHKPDALHQPWIHAIFEDSKKRLWVGSGAPYIFSREQNSFYNYNLHRNPGTPVVDGVHAFAEDDKGVIWIMNKDNYYRLNAGTNQFEEYGNIFGIGNGARPSFLRKDEAGDLWFVTTGGINCLQKKTGKVFNKTNNPDKLSIFEESGLFTSFDAFGGNVWFSYDHSGILYRYNKDTKLITKHLVNSIVSAPSFSPSFDRKIERVFSDRGENVFILFTGKGIGYYDLQQDQLTFIEITNGEPEGLHAKPELFSDIPAYVDRDKNIWIGGGRGLNIFSPRKKLFDFYGQNTESGQAGFPALNVNGFLRDKISGDIFICYYYPTAGIVRMTSGLKFKKQYLYSRAGKTNLPENQVWYLYQDKDGIIWAPNQAKSILKIDPRTDKLALFTDTALYDNISCIKDDDHGDTWIGTWKNGLKKIDRQTGKVTRYMDPPSGSVLAPAGVFSLCFDGDSSIWVGSNGAGLLKFNKRSNQFTHQYLFDEKNVRSLSNNVIHAILSWNADTLLLATSNGLNFFNRHTSAFTHLSAADGLPGDVVTNVDMDEYRNLWVGCYGGICRIRLNPLRITRYGLADGIINTSIEKGPFLKIPGERLLVPTLGGFFAFNPSAIASGQAPPSPEITGLKVFEKNIAADSLMNTTGQLHLSYRENSISVEFASLVYNTPEKLRYYYQLEGIDKDWVLSSQQQAVHYHQLPPGNYTFRVKCIDRDGLYSETSLPLTIRITPPFWKTGWFRGLLALTAIALALLLMYRQKIRRKEKEQLRIDYERRIAAMEMNILRAQMNPHFIFNSLNSINTFILKNDQENASEYLHKFSSLVRLILDNSRNDWISLDNELKALELYLDLELARFGHTFSYTISVANEIKTNAVMVPPLIIQPYAENAVRHGLTQRKEPGGKLAISISKAGDSLQIEISDNGIGRAAAAKLDSKINKLHSQSHGMTITKERLGIVNDVYNVKAGVEVTDLMDEQNQPAGTSILLTIQFKLNAGNNY
jgi:ligand-binding sensor domain-containing protein